MQCIDSCLFGDNTCSFCCDQDKYVEVVDVPRILGENEILQKENAKLKKRIKELEEEKE